MTSRTASRLASLALFSMLSSAVFADPMADQKKAYKAMGMTVPQGTKMCHLLTAGEIARYFGEPVDDGSSAGAATGCAYRAKAGGANDGVLVARNRRSDFYAPTRNPEYHSVRGVGEKAYTSREPIGYEAGALTSKGTTIVQLSGRGSAAAALSLLRLAMNR